MQKMYDHGWRFQRGGQKAAKGQRKIRDGQPSSCVSTSVPPKKAAQTPRLSPLWQASGAVAVRGRGLTSGVHANWEPYTQPISPSEQKNGLRQTGHASLTRLSAVAIKRSSHRTIPLSTTTNRAPRGRPAHPGAWLPVRQQDNQSHREQAYKRSHHMRWPCSYNTPPTIGGNTCPKDSRPVRYGQARSRTGHQPPDENEAQVLLPLSLPQSGVSTKADGAQNPLLPYSMPFLPC